MSELSNRLKCNEHWPLDWVEVIAWCREAAEHIEKLENALQEISVQAWKEDGKAHNFCHPEGCDGPGIALKALGSDAA